MKKRRNEYPENPPAGICMGAVELSGVNGVGVCVMVGVGDGEVPVGVYVLVGVMVGVAVGNTVTGSPTIIESFDVMGLKIVTRSGNMTSIYSGSGIDSFTTLSGTAVGLISSTIKILCGTGFVTVTPSGK